jgi:hypothetical protein
MSLLETTILIALAFLAGWRINQAWMLISFRQILRDLGVPEDRLRQLAEDKGIDLARLPEIGEDDQEPQTVVEIKLEQHQGLLLAFRKDNDQFLAQGTDRDTLIQRITENLTPCRVVIAKEDGADLIRN